jgi:hypothetical protein
VGFGFLSAGFDTFVEVKRLFFYYAGDKETEVKGSHWGDQMLNQTRDQTLN